MTQEKKDLSQHNAHDSAVETTKDYADVVEKVASISGAAAKSMGESLPHPIGKIGKVAEVVSGAISEQGEGWVEKAVCGTARVLTQGVASTPLAAAVIARGAIMNVSPSPYHRAFLGITSYMASAPTINQITQPVGDGAARICHKTFHFFNSSSSSQAASHSNAPITNKQHQRELAHTHLTNSAIHHQSLNGFQPNQPTSIPLIPYRDSATTYRPLYQPPTDFYSPWRVRTEIQNYINSPNPHDTTTLEHRIEMACSFLEHQTRLGYGQMSGLSHFHSTLAMTGLINSYNSYNVNSRVREATSSHGEIGGVAGDVALIQDLIDSDAHAKASCYVFCFPKTSFPFPSSLIQRVAYELKKAYFTHKTLPFFSLHFNNQGFMYPVNHDAYSNTLIGEITAFLDYWMKCFLNGGMFDEHFLTHWHESCDCNESSLRSQLIDLKEYHKANAGHYMSLRELESRYGLNTDPAQQANTNYHQPFVTSFRIISYQETIKREGNILIPTPDFRIEYSINPMPDYQDYLDKHLKEHGEYPKEYAQTRLCYELFANEIKDNMPKMPICRDYFQLLGVINTFSYAYATLEAMGKIPVIPPIESATTHSIPKAFPPIPVREYHKYPIQTRVGDIFSLFLSDIGRAKAFDDEALALFSDKQKRMFSGNISEELQGIIIHLIQQDLIKLLPSEQSIDINDDEIARITKKTTQFVLAQIHHLRTTIHRLMSSCLEGVACVDKQAMASLALPEKLKATKLALEQRFNEQLLSWDNADVLTADDIVSVFPSQHQASMRTLLASIDEKIETEWRDLTYVYKKASGIVAPAEQRDDGQLSLSDETIQSINDELAALEQTIAAKIDAEITNALAELNDIKSHFQQQINAGNQAISSQQQHKTNEVNQLGARVIALNAIAINVFCANVDKQIASIQAQVTQFCGKMALVDKHIAQLQQERSSAPHRQQHIANIKESYVADKLAFYKDTMASTRLKIYKQIACEQFTHIHEQHWTILTRFDHQIHHFSDVIKGIEPIKQYLISKQYIHTSMGFSHQDTIKNANQCFNIVGGTGMELPNIQTKPITNAKRFSEHLAQAMTQHGATGQPFDFAYDDEQYVVFELPVTDTPEQQLDNHSHTLSTLVDPTADTSMVSTEIGNQILDLSGGHMAHYAATVLDNESFAAIALNLWDKPDYLGNLPLHYAAHAGNESMINAIITRFPKQINSQNHRGLTPLFLAIEHHHMAATQALVAHHANINLVLANGLFPLFVALQNNCYDIALWLIAHQRDLILDQRIDSQMTALHLSIEAHHEPVTLSLIAQGASCMIKRKSDGFTAVHSAAKQGMVSALIAMKDKGVPLTHPLESGKTALHLAAEANQLDAILFLLKTYQDTQPKTLDGETPLFMAIKAGHLEAALILANDAELNISNTQQQTASLLAVQYGMGQVADTLIERGENPQLRDKQGNSCVYYFIRHGDESRLSALLSAKKIELNQTFHGQNMLELAAKYGHFLIVYDLLDQGLSYRKKSNTLSLLDYAIINDEIGFVKKMVSHSTSKHFDLAKLAAQKGSVSCLTWLLSQLKPQQLQHPGLFKASLESHQEQVVKHILKRQHNSNIPLDKKGNTALHLSVRYGCKAILTLLLEHGIDVRLRNHDNHTAFHIALAQEDKGLLKQLLQSTAMSEWPLDLWASPLLTPKHALYNTMMLFKKKGPAASFPERITEENTAPSAPAIAITLTLKKELAVLKNAFIDQEFTEAYDYLIEKPYLIDLFHSEEGASLLQTLFHHIDNPASTAAIVSDVLEAKEQELWLSPHQLLSHLQQAGIKPERLTGQHNVLYSLIHAETDEEACYRLHLLHQYFPNSVRTLALDKVSSSYSMMGLALTLNKKQLFTALDELCHQNHSSHINEFDGLHQTVRASNHELVGLLLKRYPVDSLNHKRQTPLMIAAQLNHVRIIEQLLEYGANPDALDIYGQNALHYAVLNGSEAAAFILLPITHHKNAANRSGLTPLMLASRQGLSAVINVLCDSADYRQSFDNKGHNALHHAALRGQSSAIKQLIQYGFDIEEKENPSSTKKRRLNLQRTPLQLAALTGHLDAVRMLLSLGADPETEDARQYTVFEYAVLSNNNDQIELLQQLPAYHQKKRDISLLMAAAKANNQDALSQLILGGVNLNSVDGSGLTALHAAAIHNSIAFARLLLAGKDVAIDVLDTHAMTALQYAARCGHVGLIDLLAKAGAKINYYNQRHPTPLFLACSQGLIGAVIALLNHQADASIPNAENITPMEIALMNGHVDIVSLLQQRDMNPIHRSERLVTKFGLYQQQHDVEVQAMSGLRSTL